MDGGDASGLGLAPLLATSTQFKSRAVHHRAAEPGRDELRWWSITDLPCLVAVALVWVLLPSSHQLRPTAALVAIGAYMVGLLIRFPAGRGYGAATQPAFVALLFTVPLNLVPVVVLAVKLLVAIGGNARRREWRRVPLALGDCWYVLPPTIIIALGAPGAVRSSAWPVYLAAFAAQFVTDLASSALRDGLADPPMRWMTAALPVALDAMLTPAGLLVAREGYGSPAGATAALVGLMGVFALISIERRNRLAHEHRALHDPLTGLANRALFAAMLESAALRAERAGRRGALLLADLDNFKSVNDTHGHTRGDEVLRAVASRLSENVRRADLVARLGGDEFAILLADQEDEPDAGHVANKLRAAFVRPLLLSDGSAVTVGLSVGVARFGEGDQAAAVLACADAAMYANKRRAALEGASASNVA